MIGDSIDPRAADPTVVAELAAWLRARVPTGARRLRVAIAGESGSGKSTLAAALREALEAAGYPTRVLHLDDYFRLPPRANAARRAADPGWLGPAEVAMDSLEEHLEAGRDAPTLIKPLVDYQGEAIGSETLSLDGVRVLVVEGTYAALLERVEVRVFMAGTHAELHERRLRRGREEQDEQLLRALAREHALVAPTMARCDWVVGLGGGLARLRDEDDPLAPASSWQTP